MNKWLSFFSLDRMYNYFGLLGGALLSALGGWDMPLQMLVGAMALDYASGVLIAIIEKKVSSSVGFIGIARKTMIFLIVMIASGLDAFLGQTAVCRTAAIAFYFVNESVSLLENAAKLGLPIPEFIREALEQVRGE